MSTFPQTIVNPPFKIDSLATNLRSTIISNHICPGVARLLHLFRSPHIRSHRLEIRRDVCHDENAFIYVSYLDNIEHFDYTLRDQRPRKLERSNSHQPLTLTTPRHTPCHPTHSCLLSLRYNTLLTLIAIPHTLTYYLHDTTNSSHSLPSHTLAYYLHETTHSSHALPSHTLLPTTFTIQHTHRNDTHTCLLSSQCNTLHTLKGMPPPLVLTLAA